MAKHVFSELDLRTLAKSPAKLVKRTHSDDKEMRNTSDRHLLSDAAATKRPRDATVTIVPKSISVIPRQQRTKNSYVVNRSEMMAFFSLLGKLSPIVIL